MKLYHFTNHNKLEPNPNYDYSRIAYGLGFYFSNSEEDASHYGINKFEIDTDDYRILRNEYTNFFTRENIASWIAELSSIDMDLYQTALSNWDEDEYTAAGKWTESIYKHSDNNPVDQLLNFQADLHLRDTARWCEIAQHLGIDGILVKDPYRTDNCNLAHVVLYKSEGK